MADVKDFIIPEQQFGGLYKLSSNLEREIIRKEDAAQKAAGKKASMATFLSNYIDPKEYFTGTVHDPTISQGINDILTKGAELAQQEGVDGNMLITALSPMVNKLGKTSQNLKELERQRKEAEGILKSRKGIDLNKFNQSFRESAYFNPDGTLKDLSEIDPTHNYTDEVLTKGDVYTPEAFDEFVAKSGKETKINRVKVTDARGGSRMTNAEMTAPTFMKPDVDASGRHIGFVPEYEEATDGDKKIMHDFLGDKGEKINAPVRMITDEVFESLPNEAKAYLRQEARRYAAQHNIPLGSQQALNFAKALGYDELKKSGKQYSTFKEIQEQKAAPAPRTSITVNTGKNPYSGVNYQEGIVFDKIGEVQPVEVEYGEESKWRKKKGRVENGYVFDENGQPLTREIEIEATKLPSVMFPIMKKQGLDIPTSGKTKFNVDRGTIVSMNHPTKGQTGREDMKTFQLSYNTEPIKSEQPNFGKSTPKPNTNNKKRTTSNGLPKVN